MSISLFAFLSLLLDNANGCLKDRATNRVTFLPVQEPASILFYSSTDLCWDDPIEKKYNSSYRPVKTNIMIRDKKRLCGDKDCQVFSSRSEKDHVVWLFLVIGYLNLIDFLVNVCHNFLVLHEFNMRMRQEQPEPNQFPLEEITPSVYIPADSPENADVPTDAPEGQEEQEDDPDPNAYPGELKLIFEEVKRRKRQNDSGLP